MQVIVKETYFDMSAAAADLVAEQLKRKPESLFCFPSGDSPTGMLDILVQRVKDRSLDLSKAYFVGLDEWVGMDRDSEGGCKHYMYSKFFDRAGIRADQIIFFDAKATDLKAECKEVDDAIFGRGGIDLIIVGIGMNGHLGLNEPGTPFDNYCHVVELEETTKNVAQKYFAGTTVLKQGITLGLKHLLEAKTAVVIAGGEKKSAIIGKAVNGPVSEQVPASIMQRHANGLILLDRAAAANVSEVV